MSENQFAEQALKSGNGSEINSEADDILHRKEFGQPLKLARVHRGLSINEVATELRLTEKIILALEESDFEQLPTATFTRGYIRAYARILELPPGDLVKEYMRASPPNEVELSQRPSDYSESSHKSRSIQLITLAIVVGFVLLLVQWVVDRSRPGGIELAPVLTEDASSPVTVDVVVFGDPAFTEKEVLSNGLDEHDPQNLIAANDEPGVAATEPAIESNSATEFDNVQADIEVASRVEPATDERNDNATVGVVVVGTGDDVLKIFSRSESWVEVDGANVNGLYYGLMEVNEIATIKGTAPFNVFLGNAPDVSVFINNFSVDMSAYIRLNKIAHFQIGIEGGRPELGKPVVVEIREKTIDIDAWSEESNVDEQE